MTSFPEGFCWGTSTSSYQIEGAVAEGGRTASIWDTFCQQAGVISDGSSGAEACDHYHRFEEDVALMKELGVSVYRFSVAWSRIQPDASGTFNPEGLAFYRRLVEALQAQGIEPWICLNHWDLPQWVEDQGGWRARATATRFAEYAEGMGKHLGELVTHWITHNEPNVISLLGHGWGVHAPGLRDLQAVQAVTHHLNLGHGLATQALRRLNPQFQLGLVVAMAPFWDREQAPEATDQFDLFWNRAFTDPCLLGTYPEALAQALQPWIEAGDLDLIHQPLDFFGLNHYCPMRAQADADEPIGFSGAAVPAGRPVTDMGWEIAPEALHQQLLELKERYGNPRVFITENGCASPDVPVASGEVPDPLRVDYLKGYLAATHRAITDGARVEGYFVWSLLDNFEWAFGYSKRFGVVHVDYATQARTPKDSFRLMQQIIRQNGLS